MSDHTPQERLPRGRVAPLASAWERLQAHGTERRLAPGEVLFREGDPGRELYMVLAGEVEVFLITEEGDEALIVLLGAGEVFGEQAASVDPPGVRNASVRARTAATLLVIPGEAFRAALEEHAAMSDAVAEAADRQRRMHLLRSLPVLRDLPISDAVEGVTRLHFEPGEVVMREGDPGDAAYVVIEGVARSRSGEALLSRSGRGQVLGERALVRSEPRSATVEAETALDLLRVEGAVFLAWARSHAPLRTLLETLAAAYHRPDGSRVTIHRGAHEGEPAITVLRALADGRRLLLTRVIDRRVFALSLDADAGDEETLEWERAGVGERCVLRLRAGRIVGLVAEGDLDFGALVERAIDPRPLRRAESARFAYSGQLVRPPRREALACACLGVSAREIADLLAAGSTAAEVRSRTGCGSVCGACVPGITADAARLGQPRSP